MIILKVLWGHEVEVCGVIHELSHTVVVVIHVMINFFTPKFNELKINIRSKLSDGPQIKENSRKATELPS